MNSEKAKATGLYFGDPSLFFFAHNRAEELKLTFNGYMNELVKLDKNGQVEWDGKIQRDALEEKLNSILEILGLRVEPSEIQGEVEIGEHVSAEQAIDILTKEGIL